ncbi:MAG TPA: response regulator [Candidatus Paceibacterota bacterium]
MIEGKNYSVLLVDDDKFLLEMYQKKFESKVAKVDVALGGEEALSKLREGLKPNIILLDIIMPGMDGLEILETIRKEKLSPSSVVIMLTNENSAEKVEKAKSLGARGYIVKATSLPSEVVDESLKIANLK